MIELLYQAIVGYDAWIGGILILILLSLVGRRLYLQYKDDKKAKDLGMF
jgi:hypothetical protein